jgi:hypothetical protein
VSLDLPAESAAVQVVGVTYGDMDEKIGVAGYKIEPGIEGLEA